MGDRPSSRPVAAPASNRIAVRRMFARAGTGDPALAAFMQTARDELLERLDGIRISPARVLDLGAGTGAVAHALARRFRGADVVRVDPVVGLLHRARTRMPRWLSKHRYVAAEAERLPLASHSVDLVLSNLAMPWFDSVDDALAECLRILRPGGLLLLNTLGPDTLKELATAWPDRARRMHPFMDMHVLGDALVHAGFADVVIDVQRMQFEAPDFRTLCRIVGRGGGSGVLATRRRGLTSPRTFRAAAARYEALRRPDGTLPVSVELVFGHAWAPAPTHRPSTGVFPRMDWAADSDSC